MDNGLCQAHTPSPLGKERDRFLKLIAEIQEQKNSNAEQFSSLTLAAMSDERNNENRSHHAIIASLTGDRQNDELDKKQRDHHSRLWQARLVLSLAEILDREEAELAENFSEIDAIEQGVFQELKGTMEENDSGEENDPFSALKRIRAKLNQQRPGTVKRRLEAWKYFYGSGDLTVSCPLWLTACEEAGDLLISSQESASNTLAAPLMNLNIPEQMYMRGADEIKAISEFRQKSLKIRKDIADRLQSIVSMEHLNHVDPIAILPDGGILARDWNEIVEYCFPGERFGVKKLDLQLLANISLDQLLRKGGAGGFRHSIIGVIRE